MKSHLRRDEGNSWVIAAAHALMEADLLENGANWAEIVEALGSGSVKEVATQFGTTPGAITLALVRTNTRREPVHAAGAPPPPARTPRQAPSADGSSDELHVRPDTRDVLIAKHAHLLGKESDAAVAELAGVSPRTVAAFRRRNGIAGKRGRGPSKKLPPEKGQRKGKKAKLRQRGKPSKLDAYAELLGTRPDREVAEMAGVSANAAAAYRRRRGIPSFRDHKASEPEAAPALAAEPSAPAPSKSKSKSKSKTSRKSSKRSAAAQGSAVYKVTLASSAVAFVVATDLVHAAQLATQHDSVVGVTFAGPLLGR